MPKYRVQVNGETYEVQSPTELTDYEAYMLAKRQMATTPDRAETAAGRPRLDTNIIGVDHERLQQGIANWASTFRPGLQKPIAFGTTFAADALASLMEMLSAPESVATMGAGGIPKPAAAVERYPTESVANKIQATGRLLQNMPGAGPKTQMVGGAMRRMRTQMADDVDHYSPNVSGYVPESTPSVPSSAGPPGSVPVETPGPAPSAPPASAPAPVPQTVGDLLLTNEERMALDRLVMQGYSRKRVLQSILKNRQAGAAPATNVRPHLNAAETKEFQRLLRAGKSETEAYDLIRQMKAMQERLQLPTSEQTRRAVYDRNLTGRWDE